MGIAHLTYPQFSSGMILSGKHALITGGGTGIGRATAYRLAEEGAEVWIAGTEAYSLEETASGIGELCHPLTCDITDQRQLDAAITLLPRLDILVANAGINFATELSPKATPDWRRMIEVNQWGTINTCLLAGQRMIRDGIPGRIVIVSSILGNYAEAGSGAYALSKAALNQLARQLAREWAAHDILVNALAPGTVLTPMSFVNGSNEYESDWFQTFFIDSKRPRIPLRRPGTPEEMAEGILFFCHPRNSYCTGQILTLDGGLTVTF